MMMSLIDNLKSRIDRLEEEQRETDNVLYELLNSLSAIDRRIDIIAEEYQLNKNV